MLAAGTLMTVSTVIARLYTQLLSFLAATLESQLTEWLSAVGDAEYSGARAIIAPHAGYSYSGPTAAYAYKQINPTTIRRIFLLGPSHHFYLPGCALTKHTYYATPMGNINIDRQTTAELAKTGQFDTMDTSVDEEEHSLEMHLPYIYHIMLGHEFVLVPVLVGGLNFAHEAEYGSILAPYLADPATAFIISSDFCHWGRRFNYTYVPPGHDAIYKGIEALDREGMTLIEAQDAAGFSSYLKRTQNTICGRHPIGVLLQSLATLEAAGKTVKFVRYAQSSACKSERDSSVSYASAAVTIS